MAELSVTGCGYLGAVHAAWLSVTTDRDSPALDVASRTAGLGAQVTVTDSAALENVRQARPHLVLADDQFEAAQDADVVLLLTEWRRYTDLDPEEPGRAAGWSHHRRARR